MPTKITTKVITPGEWNAAYMQPMEPGTFNFTLGSPEPYDLSAAVDDPTLPISWIALLPTSEVGAVRVTCANPLVSVVLGRGDVLRLPSLPVASTQLVRQFFTTGNIRLIIGQDDPNARYAPELGIRSPGYANAVALPLTEDTPDGTPPAGADVLVDLREIGGGLPLRVVYTNKGTQAINVALSMWSVLRNADDEATPVELIASSQYNYHNTVGLAVNATDGFTITAVSDLAPGFLGVMVSYQNPGGGAGTARIVITSEGK